MAKERQGTPRDARGARIDGLRVERLREHLRQPQRFAPSRARPRSARLRARGCPRRSGDAPSIAASSATSGSGSFPASTANERSMRSTRLLELADCHSASPSSRRDAGRGVHIARRPRRLASARSYARPRSLVARRRFRHPAGPLEQRRLGARCRRRARPPARSTAAPPRSRRARRPARPRACEQRRAPSP